ncbi:UDP-N-acetylmuramoyl-tripeptide--D-alanyl-D-alanine ligase [Flavobacteriaceae bacterium]|nr:UDP-N-acetylmuramoyl-tripeptide--D-alanyl-D-alanine ligase [Flavobacteriaceae bacterium]
MKLETVYSYFLESTGICTDTRKIEKGCLFVALRGDNFNGNKFTQQALDKGAFKVIIDDISQHKNTGETILCKNSLTLLQKLATYHRQKLNVPMIALTGSNGKTTTKEIINAVLSKKFKTTATLGNLNNHIGVPLTLLSMTKETQIGIVEMGANHKKEIEALCEIAQPNFGYITNFGKAHIEGFGSIEGVIEGKSELYKYISKEKGTLFFNADDPIQNKLLGNYPSKVGFSQTKENFYTLKQIDVNPYVALQAAQTNITSNLIGAYNFTNISAGVLIGDFFDIPLNDIKQAIEEYLPTNNRSQLITKGSTQIILDAYNANPTSMMAALQHFNTIKTASKMVFLGDMFELGETAQEEHQDIVDYLSNTNIDEVHLIGSYFSKTKLQVKNCHQYKTFEALKSAFKNTIPKDTTVLIKASRGMALERILPLL